LIFLRILGIGIALDFYSKSKDPNDKIFILAWLIWLISGILPLITLNVSNQQLSEILFFYNITLSTISILLLGYLLITYYVVIHRKYVIIFIIITLLIAHLLYFIVGYGPVVSFGSLVSQFAWLILILLPLVKWSKFKERVDKRIWYMFFTIIVLGLLYIPLGIIIYLRGFSFGLFNADDPLLISLNYGYVILITVLLHALTLHLEYRKSEAEKHDLKDKYSHNLGNVLQSIYTSLDLLNTLKLSKEDENMVRQTLGDKLVEAAKLIEEIRDL